MRFVINRENLIKPLQLVAGIVERRQTLIVLSNVLLSVHKDVLLLTGTDLEVELIGKVALQNVEEEGATTVSARKLMDICKALPEQSEILIYKEENKLIIVSGPSRFCLAVLSAEKYPNIEEKEGNSSFVIDQASLRYLIERTGFAMAQQDVRYYLNGVLLEIGNEQLRVVATDGHRMAMCTLHLDLGMSDDEKGYDQFIVPRKGILGLARLIAQGGDEKISISLGSNHMRGQTSDFVFTTKLVDGKFPDYERVILKNGDKKVVLDREVVKQALQRVSILSNEKCKGVQLRLDKDRLKITANNPEQELAEEELDVDYGGKPLNIGFNVHYILHVLSVLNCEKVIMVLSGPNDAVLIKEPDSENSLYVIMPMRL
ncbi:MAG: DNA polymerase III subunit beta [Endozoicomonadaceae bacterium]|nr:DNA polymerase III subunit beta [Endozoicomonadaceae bacterium]MCY4328866.1 DNA polymerase III subunit beta [Endozoicomonadaceae bacterium]